MQKTKALIWLFPENIKRVKKQADSYFWGGGCSGNSRENPWSLITSLHFVRLPSSWPCHRQDSSRWLLALSNESTLRIRWPKYWSFSFNISLSNEHPVLIFFRMDWLHLLALQGTLKSLLPHHSSKASILQCSDFFTAQFSHTYMTTGETIAWLDGHLLAK